MYNQKRNIRADTNEVATVRLVKKYIYPDAKYVRRADDTSKVIIKDAQEILHHVLYRLNKFDVAIVTHETLKEVTGKSRRQNSRLLSQLGFVLDIEFHRKLEIDGIKYNDVYRIRLVKNAEEILENPEEYFAKNEQELNKKLRTYKARVEVIEDRRAEVSNVSTCGHTCHHLRSPMAEKSDPLYIYLKDNIKDKINDNVKSNQKNHFNFSFNSSSFLETSESEISTNEFVEKSHFGSAGSECEEITQANQKTDVFVEAQNQKREVIPLANQKTTSKSIKTVNVRSVPFKSYKPNRETLSEAIKLSNKPNYLPEQVEKIISRILEQKPDMQIYGGKAGLLKYLVKVIDNEYEVLPPSETKKEISPEMQARINEEATKVKWEVELPEWEN